jgi:hypothetical protein
MRYVLVGVLIFFGLWVAGSVFGWFGEVAQVAHDEVGPRALLKKYEWFKEAAAQLDAKRANIEAAKQRSKSMASLYGDAPRSKWSREDREQYNLWESEVAGIVSNYNGLAADYNAAHAKLNWKFADVGALPQGAAAPLPREYAPYATE